jgi:ketosteroid isomerase-like protein
MSVPTSRHRVLLPALALAAMSIVITTRDDAPPQSSPGADVAAIRASIERGARGFERGDPDSILEHYAPDVILSYPGIPDQDYATLARGYAQLRSRPPSVTATTVPTFDEILVSGDLAIARLRWTTTIRVAASDSSAERSATRYLRDLQVWRREKTGMWRFIRGMHYRDSTLAP